MVQAPDANILMRLFRYRHNRKNKLGRFPLLLSLDCYFQVCLDLASKGAPLQLALALPSGGHIQGLKVNITRCSLIPYFIEYSVHFFQRKL